MKLASVSHEENILCIFPRFSSCSPAKLEVHHCSASKKISGTAVGHAKIESTKCSSLALSRSHKLEDIRAFSETDMTEDLKKFDIPTLIIHGDDDQIVPIGDSALLSSKIVKDATLKIYPGAPHGLMSTHKEQFNADLLAFLRS